MKLVLSAHGFAWGAGMCSANVGDPIEQHGNVCRGLFERDSQHEQAAQQRIAEARAAAFREAVTLARDYAQWLYGLVDCAEKGDIANNVADRIEEAAKR